MARHLGIKKTLNRILDEFFWPGVCGDVQGSVSPTRPVNEYCIREVKPVI